MLNSLKRIMVGKPLASAAEKHERLGKFTGLAVFSSDAVSSVAYGPEEVLLALVTAGTGALAFSIPIGIGISILVLIVASSYWQTIHAYPSGGGSYIVASDNLGTLPGLIAGAALLTDYVLTVSVSVASGIAAITSAFPPLYPWRVTICVLSVAGIALANLRGVRESGRLFAVPTYWFIGSVVLLILTGLFRVITGTVQPLPTEEIQATHVLSLFLIMRAFSGGCATLTGTEAVSNGIPAFRPPESRNAGMVMVWMAVILSTTSLGITYLARAYNIAPHETETVASILARSVFGGENLLYYNIQFATMLILLVAANTSFADFPRLSSIMARDGFMPRQLANRGDRLVFSNGVLILSALSILLLIIFRGDTHALIPLYAIGVFLSFTLSQAGMVRHWLKLKDEHPKPHHIILNALGAVTTGIVTIVIAVSKFALGAWIVVVLIPFMVICLLQVRRHYEVLGRQLSLEGFSPPKLGRHPVVVLVGGIHRGVVTALTYAKAISPNVTAITVDLDPTATSRLQMQWQQWAPDIPLVILDSPYRSVIQPVLHYIDQMEKQRDGAYMTIILPEFVPAKWWQHLLHNQTALLIKGALLFRRGKVAISIPYHLDQ
jgi:amino acid transporter